MYNFANLVSASKNPSTVITQFRKNGSHDDDKSYLFNRTALWLSDFSFHENVVQPKIKILPYVLQELRGIRPNGLEGAIINFNSKYTYNAKDPLNLESGAHRLLEDAEISGSHYATISRSGTIYLPSYWNWLDYGSYAEAALCPVTMRGNVSQYYVGLEINSPGFAYPTARENQFIAWYDAKRGSQGQILLQDGLAMPLNSDVKYYNISEVWEISGEIEGEAPRYFIPYTSAQQFALMNLLIWLKSFYPKSFRYEQIFGYDEITRRAEKPCAYSDHYPTPEAETMAQLRNFMLKS